MKLQEAKWDDLKLEDVSALITVRPTYLNKFQGKQWKFRFVFCMCAVE
jgi:hypothetical protein